MNDTQRMTTPMDLSETSFAEAVKMLGTPPMGELCLIAGQEMAYSVGFICGRFGEMPVKPVLLPNDMVERDAWAVTDGIRMIWSPGA